MLTVALAAGLYFSVFNKNGKSTFIAADSLAKNNTPAAQQPEDLHAIPAQLPEDYFGPPLHGELTCSGSFAELRSNHFHSGVDLRTGGTEGKPVLASADGFVYRIRVGPYGFGKALYLAHPNGYTTVYGHLRNFNTAIENYTQRKQYQSESFDQELYLTAGTLPVKKGDTIAWSGNTGGSGGPHLHFEIRRTANDQIINPLLFGIKIKDSIDPFIKSILLVKINAVLKDRLGYYPERISRQAPALKKSKEVLAVPPGNYGLAVSEVDYFSDFASRLGINYAELYAGDQLIFSRTVEHFLFDETRQVNTYMDFAFYREKGVRYARMFKTEGNKLHFYKAINNGIFYVAAGDSIKLKLVLKDLAGHKDELNFTLSGSETATLSAPKPKDDYAKTWKVNHKADNRITFDGFSIEAGAGHFMDDAEIGLSSKAAPAGALSPMYVVHGEKIPLFKSATIGIKPDKAISNPANYVIIYKDLITGFIQCENGNYSGGKVYTTVKNLGAYYLMADSTAPVISVLRTGRRLLFRIADNLSGIDSYRLLVDGQWVLMEYDYKNGNLWGNIPAQHGAGKHSFELIVKDKAGNTKKINQNINL